MPLHCKQNPSNLLLDSARTLGNHLHIDIGYPETNSAGVPKSWYVLRATYSRELKIQAQLSEMGVRCFIPMMWRRKETEGKIEKKLVPAVNNLCFVYWTKQEINEYIRSFGDKSPVSYYWDRTAGKALTVPDNEMENFIKVASTFDEDLLYLTEVSDKLREGQTIKIKDGPLAGVVGKVVRIRKSSRILVELPGMLAVATTYVAPENLEMI